MKAPVVTYIRGIEKILKKMTEENDEYYYQPVL